MKSASDSLTAALETPSPWLRPYVPLLRQIANAADSDSVAEALNHIRTDRIGKWRFVEQSMLPANEPYESFIYRTSCIPTRDNLHDLFNGFMWLSYPLSKRRLNAMQAEEIKCQGATGARGALRDALTLFDENAAVLQAPSQLVDSLRRRDWHGLFIEHRQLWQTARLVVFGHALLEKLMQPRKAITAHVWLVDELTDDALVASLCPERLRAKAFLPLPVLGIPGWWAANEEPGFYDDPCVFRLPRE